MPRFWWRLVVGPAAILLLVVATVGELAVNLLESAAAASAQRHLEGHAYALADEARIALAGEAPRDWVVEIARRSGLRVALFHLTGQVAADSNGGDGHSANESSRPELTAARGNGTGFSLRHGRNNAPRGAHFALRLGDLGESRGFLRLSDEKDPVDGPIRRLRTFVLLGAAIGCLLLCWASYRMSRQIEQPLDRIGERARAMAAGDFEPRLAGEDLEPFDDLSAQLDEIAQLSRERAVAGASDRHKVAAVLGAMVEGVVAVDVDQNVMHVNTAAARILGVQAARTEGRRVQEVTRIPEVSDVFAAVLETGTEQSRELRVVAPPRDRWVEMHATPLRASGGEVVGAVLVLHDVTELRRLESVRRDFVANVSHELKTPIAAIRGIVETVLDDPEMETEVRDRFLGRVREQSIRLSTLVTDLLTLSRVESGDPVRTAIDFRMPVREAAAQLSAAAEQRSIQIEVSVPDEPVTLLGDLDSLRLVVSNLLDNALKYSPVGDTVLVRLTFEENRARLVVEDHGIGIERKEQERIFQRFYRVDKARSRDLGGTGLGLSIVKHVALAHGGRVGVDSAPGAGSRFWVLLPLA
ncbi:MAG: sensor histidine kinase [Planctomycetota bacterium]